MNILLDPISRMISVELFSYIPYLGPLVLKYLHWLLHIVIMCVLTSTFSFLCVLADLSVLWILILFPSTPTKLKDKRILCIMWPWTFCLPSWTYVNLSFMFYDFYCSKSFFIILFKDAHNLSVMSTLCISKNKLFDLINIYYYMALLLFKW